MRSLHHHEIISLIGEVDYGLQFKPSVSDRHILRKINFFRAENARHTIPYVKKSQREIHFLILRARHSNDICQLTTLN